MCPTGWSVCVGAIRRQLSEVGAVCGSAARTDLCGGRVVRFVPTATLIFIRKTYRLTTSPENYPSTGNAGCGLYPLLSKNTRASAAFSAKT